MRDEQEGATLVESGARWMRRERTRRWLLAHRSIRRLLLPRDISAAVVLGEMFAAMRDADRKGVEVSELRDIVCEAFGSAA